MVMKETRITQAIIQKIKELGGDAYHVHGNSVQRSGEPDISGELDTHTHLKVEVKTPDGSPSELQLHRLVKYNHYGYLVGIVTSVEEFMELLTCWNNAEPLPSKFLSAWMTDEMREEYISRGWLDE